ncbi:TAXI family TRAP transporter solute-binding subunit [Pseudonocardia sp. DSM 110487]|uniref:TAXI family TRAP transporter solute-binding subunit n=1 Tax=Pseudonocardia sp. DSM 110487 TaxID=2865833 RepID=UPI001C6A3EFA|nr:TAXI family TRAP transporter solute-binding subunit [Pseudonocardia sp. DSM 110487]QYN36056.1 TAXI family TRAP transporter solute-binding subunit [Pseudonocardia sp. DSM 110487]
MVVTTKRRSLAVVVAAGALLLSACGGGETAAPGADRSLSIATGGTGGVYYPYGGAMGTLLSDKLGVTATAQETNASVDNVLLVQDGGADIAFALGDTVADAVAGKAQFEGRQVTLCTLGKLYNNFTQTITTSGTGIRSIADLRGKRVSVGSPGSGTEVIALRLLEAAGINPESDIQRSQLGVGETAQALRDGTIDAGFWSGGLPTGALVDLATTGQMVLLPTGEYTQALASKFGPYYETEDIPANTYEGQAEASPQVVVPNVLIVRSDMPQQLQQDITRAVFENKAQLAAVHPAANDLDPATADDVGFVEVCPGAKAYFDQATG